MAFRALLTFQRYWPVLAEFSASREGKVGRKIPAAGLTSDCSTTVMLMLMINANRFAFLIVTVTVVAFVLILTLGGSTPRGACYLEGCRFWSSLRLSSSPTTADEKMEVNSLPSSASSVPRYR